MANANTRHDGHRQVTEQYPETSTNDHRRERDYYAEEHAGYPSDNYPQYDATDKRIRRGNDEHYDPRHRHAGPPSYGANEFRSGPARYAPLRFGDDGDIRHDSFGYTEVEHPSHRLEPYRQYGSEQNWRDEPAFRDQEYGDFGVRWRGQAHPGHARPAYRDPYAAERSTGNYERDVGRYGEGYGARHGGLDHDPLGRGGEHHAGHGRHVDQDYHQWRQEQIQNLDRDYDDWRRERFQKFSEDFNNWRSTRPSRDVPSANESPAVASTKHGASGLTATLPTATSASGTKK